MRHQILTTVITSNLSLVSVRDRARQIGELFDLDNLQRTRFITAISELVRNAIQHAGGGLLKFYVGDAKSSPASGPVLQCVIAEVSDKGPGMTGFSLSQADESSQTNSGIGIAGSRRLVDGFFIESVLGQGTTVTVEMLLPKRTQRISIAELNRLTDQLTRRKAQTPFEELELQNRDMLLMLEELRQRKTDLEVADERKNEFLAMLAHELRNPLGAISLAIEACKRTPSLETLEIINRQTVHLTRMVGDLLDVSRLTRGKVDLQTEVVSLSALLDGAIEMTQLEVEKRGHRIVIGEFDPHIKLRADAARIKQVFSNILHNAARYSPSPGDIIIHVRLQDQQVEIEFEDHGIGIEANLLSRVFDLFAQGQSGIQRQESGLGIGLTVVQRLVLDHGGSINVYSEGLGRGSRFVVCLPTVDEPLSVAALPLSAVANSGSHKILLIDDNRDSAAALSQILEIEGAQCREAYTGANALALFETFRADICVVDIGLPDMTGFDVARQLRTRQGEAPLMLVALSGYASQEIKEEASDAGFDYYFSKPLPLGDLLALISGF